MTQNPFLFRVRTTLNKPASSGSHISLRSHEALKWTHGSAIQLRRMGWSRPAGLLRASAHRRWVLPSVLGPPAVPCLQILELAVNDGCLG